MKFKDLFKKLMKEEKVETVNRGILPKDESMKSFEGVAPENIGRLDLVIAFDTTGSMAAYIGAVRKEVSELVPRLFKNNEDLRLGIVAFGDYCDMRNAQEYGDAYQCLMPTNNENEIVKFINDSKNTNGGDGDEFYELVIKKVVEETPWREGATKVLLLISDAVPHPMGYTYKDYVVGNQIDWRKEAGKAASMGIKIDTVSITGAPWYKELSDMTNGVNTLFQNSCKTARLVEAATLARGSNYSREMFDSMHACCCSKPDSEVDKELEERGLRFVRYADDSNIFVKSEMSANRVMKSVTSWLERKLFLKVSATKTKVVRPTNSNFLGFTYCKGGSKWECKPTNKSRMNLYNKCRFELIRKKCTSRCNAITFTRINQIVKGWINYFRIGKMKTFIDEFGQWLRHKIRAILSKQWKKPNRIYTNLKRLNERLPYHFTEEQIYSVANSRLGWYRRASGWVSSFLLNADILAIRKGNRPGLVNPLEYYLR